MSSLTRQPLPWDNATPEQIRKDIQTIGTKLGHNMAKWGTADEKPLEVKVWPQTMVLAGILETNREMLEMVSKESGLYSGQQSGNDTQA